MNAPSRADHPALAAFVGHAARSSAGAALLVLVADAMRAPPLDAISPAWRLGFAVVVGLLGGLRAAAFPRRGRDAAAVSRSS